MKACGSIKFKVKGHVGTRKKEKKGFIFFSPKCVCMCVL